MDALIYTAMSGADRMLKAQQIHANNIANAETGGFRADIGVSTSQTVPGYGYDARHLSQNGANAVDMRSGAVVETGRELDVAVKGEGFFAVQGPDGNEAYTRAGAMVADMDGKLSVNGHPVLGDGGQITLPPDYVKLHIGSDGVISVLAAGESEMQPIDKLKLVKPLPQDIAKDPNGLVISRQGGVLAADDTVKVQGEHLERSNVSAVEEMVATMTLNRNFEMQMRLFNSASDMVEAGNRLVRA
ncbi:flagellar basal-body rod protein FlgF [Chromobacterium alkanivorans]|uniref:flagellar basal body rod protein FlgF n=1 Tax=Chromobacterium alkanivorans TaxID=1071719 RepID=UPI00216776B6|nr:flagellar basal body rod protein FlgF [Chromobacterium alkanivorans]MCS3806825.1 flagellar basal-body rod protein FlgF [Chromobacterium alkanivorans]MCS3821207.1 flagellar basal-body rod protein FlgF [Chromobacterium alkanivorans]MCS3876162.1 flagellar basal-body rod protein FlgF [Chromobacterium alkanivorans]